MELIRVGEKMISLDRLVGVMEDMLRYRALGSSQIEVARKFNVDRSFVSRLETLGEIRKGRSVALIGFPIANTDEVQRLCQKAGVDYCWVMTDRERRDFAEHLTGVELVNEIMRVAAELRTYDVVVLLASNARVRLMEALLDARTVVPMILGETPLLEDVHVQADQLLQLIDAVRLAGEG